MIRLDLPKVNCHSLSLIAHIEMPDETANELIAASLSFVDDEDDVSVALYGSRYTINDTVHIVMRSIWRA